MALTKVKGNVAKRPFGLPNCEYRTIKKIGKGHQGEVFLVEYQGQKACAKVYYETKNLMQEVLMLEAAKESLCTPSLLRVMANTVLMEYVEGITLQKFLSINPCWLTIHAAMMAFGQTLDKVHQTGVVHNDLKFDNAIVSLADSTVKVTLIDFAWASTPNSSPYPHICQFEIMRHRHVSPKLAEGGKCDFSTDNYSFGILLECLAARLKCPSMSIIGQMLTSSHGTFLSLATLIRQISPRNCKSCQLRCPCPCCTGRRFAAENKATRQEFCT